MSQIVNLAREERSFDLCSFARDEKGQLNLQEAERVSYEFALDQFLFQITLYPDEEHVRCVLTSHLSCLPYTVENIAKRFFFLNLLKIVSLKDNIPIMMRDERYIVFETSWEEERPVTLEKLVYQSLIHIIGAMPYMELFRNR